MDRQAGNTAGQYVIIPGFQTPGYNTRNIIKSSLYTVIYDRLDFADKHYEKAENSSLKGYF